MANQVLVVEGKAQVSTLIKEATASMTTPTVISGVGHEIRHKPGMPVLAVAFSSEAGDFAMQLCVSMDTERK